MGWGPGGGVGLTTCHVTSALLDVTFSLDVLLVSPLCHLVYAMKQCTENVVCILVAFV